MKRHPIVCPKCQEIFDPEAFLKVKRARASVEAIEVTKKNVTLFEDEFDATLEESPVVEDSELIEDPSDLDVGDDDDMTEVIDHADLDGDH
jgi:hypothetical protein